MDPNPAGQFELGPYQRSREPSLAVARAGRRRDRWQVRVRRIAGSLTTKARGHFPTDDAVVKLLWLAIINIEDKRARERAARHGQDGARSSYPGRLIEGTKTYGWPEALNELAAAYPGRIR